MPGLAILWEQWTGYLDASVRALCSRHPVRLLRAHVRPVPEAPFRPEDFIAAEQVYTFDSRPEQSELAALLERFQPDALLVASWHRPEYRRIARSFSGRATRIVGMDNQWHGTLKQWGGRLIAPFFIQPAYDKALVAGPRQRAFARRLGFAEAAIREPLYACDVAAFARVEPNFERGKFLFVGRLVEEKGVGLLVDAYRAYRARAGMKAWGLIVAGVGPLRPLVTGVEGIECRDFVQPAELASLYAEASCLVLPSRFEPWGVVLHEAVAAGLPVICSKACGAGDVFVRHGRNGFVFETGDPSALAGFLGELAGLPAATLRQFSELSRAASRTITPEVWADVMWTMIGRDGKDSTADRGR